jgi:hypothetical protein
MDLKQSAIHIATPAGTCWQAWVSSPSPMGGLAFVCFQGCPTGQDVGVVGWGWHPAFKLVGLFVLVLMALVTRESFKR